MTETDDPGAPAARPAPPAEGVPAARPAPPAEGVPAARPAPPAEGVPAARPASPAEGVPAARPAPPAEGVPDRLYGRRRGHPLRPRQERLLAETLPRLRLAAAAAANPLAAFATPVRQVWLEVGFGGGEHALALRDANPDIGLIASEVFENGLCSLLSRLVPEGREAEAPLPGNLRLWPEDARRLLAALPAAALDRLYLMFPDPWPKARHAKRRFVHPALLGLVARVLKPGAEWRLASDDPTYQAWVAEVFRGTDLFTLASPATVRPEDWPPTRYEQKALREDRQPFYWVATRR